jgi:methionine biosynthesis protein MetW
VSAEPSQVRTPFHQFEVGFNIIIDMIEPGTRVLDLGCGSGTLLQRLRDEKSVEGCGVELDQEKVIRCVERGLRVMTLDLDEGLGGFPDLSYEYVVLSRTLQQLAYPDKVIKEMLRVGSKSIITCPNFGHWQIMMESVLTGRTPISEAYPHPWYGTPDIHRITINDVRSFIDKMGGKVEQEVFVIKNQRRDRPFWPNRTAEWGCFLISTA